MKPQGGRYVPALDVLRLLAAFMVVVYHYGHRGGLQYTKLTLPAWDGIFRYGYLGVELLFMISGFVIMQTAANSSWPKFLAKRFARLYPSLLFAAVISFLVVSFDPLNTIEKGISSLLCDASFALPVCEVVGIPHVDGVYWSLTIEIIFYAFVTLLIATHLTGDKKLLVVMSLWVCMALLVALFPLPGALQLVGKLMLLHYAALFAAGAAFYQLRSGTALKHGYHALIGLSLITSGLWVHADAVELSGKRSIDYDPMIAVLLLSSFFVVFAAIAAGAFSGINRKVAYTAGALTYPLYLIHQNVGYVVINNLQETGLVGSLTVFWLAILVATALAQIMVWTSERMSTAFGRHIDRRLKV